MAWLYKEGEEPKQFKNEEAIEDALEDGWVDTPAGFKKDEEVNEIVLDEQSTLARISGIAKGLAEETLLYEELSDADRELYDGVQALWDQAQNQDAPKVDEIPLSEYSDKEVLLTLKEIKQECIKRELEIEEVIPRDIDGDGEGDINLNDLSDDELKKLLDDRGENYPHNIGREKLLKRLSKPEEE